ncbi:MAG: peptide deformylase, partial [Anaerolineae bacterium]|nr:peptide deformylase [Anaerolineae bacterium]
MAILPIIQPDNPILLKKAYKISKFDDPVLQQLIEDMAETLAEARGVGLAAPQVAQSIRLILVRLPDETDEDRKEYGDQAGKLHIFLNPKITKESREMVSGVEGCLSMPGLLGEVDRHEMVVVTGQDRAG